MNGKVRLLDPSSPLIPPAIPWSGPEIGYVPNRECWERVPTMEVPEDPRVELLRDPSRSFYCTRPGHEGPHACHKVSKETGELEVVIVWGGE